MRSLKPTQLLTMGVGIGKGSAPNYRQRHHAGRRGSEHQRVLTLPGHRDRDRDRGLHRARATRARLALSHVAPEQRLCTRHARVRGLERSPLRSRHGALRASRPARSSMPGFPFVSKPTRSAFPGRLRRRPHQRRTRAAFTTHKS